jgi:hypothetical protein
MSNIGKVNLDLQEQANELSFSTVQEAVDNGYAIVYDVDGEPKLMTEEDCQHLQAHNAWLIERETILNELRMLADAHLPNAVRNVIGETIKFIEKGEV